MKIVLFILLFLFLGAFFIVSNQNLALRKPDALNLFSKQYTAWLDNLFVQGKQITGYVARSDWLPSMDENSKIIAQR